MRPVPGPQPAGPACAPAEPRRHGRGRVPVLRSAAAAAAALLVLSGCGGSGLGKKDDLVRTSVCAVSSPSGFSDHSLGQAVFDQVRQAMADGAIDSTSSQRVSTPAQTRTVLERYAGQACTLTVLVGPGGGEELAEVARESPAQAFLAVSASAQSQMPDNVLTLDFELEDPAYLAGFAAASATETGTVAAVVGQGFPSGAEVLAAFDEGARAYGKLHDEEIVVLGEAGVAERTLSDTVSAGRAWAAGAEEAGADVLAPFGSAAPQGVVAHLAERVEDAEAAPAEDGDTPAAEDAQGSGEAEADAAEDAEDAPPSLIWYGADGAKVLPRALRQQVLLSVVPEPGLGLRALLASWPGEGGDPELLVTDADSAEGAQPAEPQLVAGLEVRSRRAVGTLGNEGVRVVPSDGALSSVTGLGRELADELARMEDEAEEG
jgi:basic membrane protein A